MLHFYCVRSLPFFFVLHLCVTFDWCIILFLHHAQSVTSSLTLSLRDKPSFLWTWYTFFIWSSFIFVLHISVTLYCCIILSQHQAQSPPHWNWIWERQAFPVIQRLVLDWTLSWTLSLRDKAPTSFNIFIFSLSCCWYHISDSFLLFSCCSSVKPGGNWTSGRFLENKFLRQGWVGGWVNLVWAEILRIGNQLVDVQVRIGPQLVVVNGRGRT